MAKSSDKPTPPCRRHQPPLPPFAAHFEWRVRAAAAKRARADGRAKRATFQRWLREHAPLVYLGLYAGADDIALAAEHRRRRELRMLARVRRDALAYCIECRNPLLASEYGVSQFCPYERAGQHEKLRRAREQSSPATTERPAGGASNNHSISQSVVGFFPDYKSAFPSRTPVEGTRPILNCAAGACDEVPREERGAGLRGAAPASATIRNHLRPPSRGAKAGWPRSSSGDSPVL